jgi:hypothetical protein
MIKSSYDIYKISEALWRSLQKHLNTLYETEKQSNKCLIFADEYPFDPKVVDAEKLNEYWIHRNKLKDLFIDETEQLATLVKTINQKNYKEEDKKYLFLLILGYMDIVQSIFNNLEMYKPLELQTDEELANNLTKFNKIKNYVKLHIKGITPRL